MDKVTLRKIIKEKKRELTQEYINSNSFVIHKRLYALPEYNDALNVYIYASYNQEVITNPIMEHALKSGKTISVPKIIDKDMVFVRINSVDELRKGAYNIPEPISSVTYENTDKGIVIMPLLAVDKSFNRLGYGGGYYDRFLEKHKDLFTIALAYDFQLVDTITTDEYDIPVNMIITPSGVLRKEGNQYD